MPIGPPLLKKRQHCVRYSKKGRLADCPASLGLAISLWEPWLSYMNVNLQARTLQQDKDQLEKEASALKSRASALTSSLTVCFWILEKGRALFAPLTLLLYIHRQEPSFEHLAVSTTKLQSQQLLSARMAMLQAQQSQKKAAEGHMKSLQLDISAAHSAKLRAESKCKETLQVVSCPDSTLCFKRVLAVLEIRLRQRLRSSLWRTHRAT